MNDKFLLHVVKSSLNIENNLSKVIYQLFNVIDPLSKKLFKPNNFTAKNKIDLLRDLGLLGGDEYKLILLQIEIRNVFIHNLDITNLDECFKYMFDSTNSNANKNSFSKIEGKSQGEKFDNLCMINITNIDNVKNNEVKRTLKITNEVIALAYLMFKKQQYFIDLSRNLAKIEKTNDIEIIKKELRITSARILKQAGEFQMEYEKNELFKMDLVKGIIQKK